MYKEADVYPLARGGGAQTLLEDRLDSRQHHSGGCSFLEQLQADELRDPGAGGISFAVPCVSCAGMTAAMTIPPPIAHAEASPDS